MGFKEDIERQYWKDVEREEQEEMDNAFAISMGNFCYAYLRKNCIGCPNQIDCEKNNRG